jgi:hypothetical protein
MRNSPFGFAAFLGIIAIGYAVVSCSFCWADSYNAFSQQTAIDSAFYQDTSQAVSNTGQDTTTVSVASTGAESSADISTTSTATTSSNIYTLLEDAVNAAGKKLISVGTTTRTAYLYDFVNGKGSAAIEYRLARYYPGNQDNISLDVAAGFIVSDEMRGEASIYAQCDKKAKLILLDTQSVGIGGHVQHGLHGKFGGGICANAWGDKILGIEVSKIMETIAFWAKEKSDASK